MAGHGTLDPGVEVRVLLPQPWEWGVMWAVSSAGERLPYKQEVVGSKPTPPTIKIRGADAPLMSFICADIFLFPTCER